MESSEIRRFDAFELDLRTGELRRDGRPVPLQRQPALVLAALVRHSGTLVSRQDLKDAVWTEHTYVDFNRGLNYCIRHLRDALGDEAKAPRFIETVARQGYRFVAPVAVFGRNAQTHERASWLRPRVLAAAALAAVILLTVWVESGPGTNHHAAMAATARAVHDFLF